MKIARKFLLVSVHFYPNFYIQKICIFRQKRAYISTLGSFPVQEPPVRKMHVHIVTVIHVKRLDASGSILRLTV